MDESIVDEQSGQEVEMVSVVVGSVRNLQLHAYRTQKNSSRIREECKLLNKQIKSALLKNEKLRCKKLKLSKAVTSAKKEFSKRFDSALPLDVAVMQAAAALYAQDLRQEETIEKLKAEFEENLKSHAKKCAEIYLQWKEVPVVARLQEMVAKIASLEQDRGEMNRRRQISKQAFIDNCVRLAHIYRDNRSMEDRQEKVKSKQENVARLQEQKGALLARLAEKEAKLKAAEDARQPAPDEEPEEEAAAEQPTESTPVHFKRFPVYDYAEFDDDTVDYGESQSQQEEMTGIEDNEDLDLSVLSFEQTMEGFDGASTFPTSGPLATSTPLSADAVHRRNEEAPQADRETQQPMVKRPRLEPLLEETDDTNIGAVERQREDEHMSTIDYQQQGTTHQPALLQQAINAQYGNAPQSEEQQPAQNLTCVPAFQAQAPAYPTQDNQQRGPPLNVQMNAQRVTKPQNSEQYHMSPQPVNQSTRAMANQVQNEVNHQVARQDVQMNPQRVTKPQNTEYTVSPQPAKQNTRPMAQFSNSPANQAQLNQQRAAPQEVPMHQQQMRVMAQHSSQELSPRQAGHQSYTSPQQQTQLQFMSYSPQSATPSSSQQFGRGYAPQQQHAMMHQGAPDQQFQQSGDTDQQYFGGPAPVNHAQDRGYEMPSETSEDATLTVDVSGNPPIAPVQNDSLARYAKSPVSDDYSADPVSSPPPPTRGAAPAPGAGSASAAAGAAPGLFDFRTPEQQDNNFLFNSFFKLF